MADDVLLGKAQAIERCLRRVREEFTGHEDELATNFTRQDAIVLNLLRACETAIDASMHMVRVDRLGLPERSRDAFRLLVEAGVLNPDLGLRMEKMVGFRNLAVHQYQALDLNILRSIITRGLTDFEELVAVMLRRA